MKKYISIFCISILLSGCMSFNNGELPKVKPPSPPTVQPIIEIKVGSFYQKLNGAGTSRGMISNRSEANRILNALLSAWVRNGLIKDYDNIGDLKVKPDYTLILNGYRNEDMSFFGSFFSGLSLFIFPSSTTLIYNLDFVLINNNTEKEYSCSLQNSETTWVEILLLPGFPLFWLGTHNMWVDTSMYAYNKFNEQGAFGLDKKVSNNTQIKNIINEYKKEAKNR